MSSNTPPITITCNYDADTGSIPLSDEQIEAAIPFVGHEPEFLHWPKSLWFAPPRVPCLDPEKNAYHVRYLAGIMESKGWIGGPFKVNPVRHCWDASHRIRAAKYLLAKGITLEIPEPSVWVGDHNGPSAPYEEHA
jgi:hypothetical protein